MGALSLFSCNWMVPSRGAGGQWHLKCVAYVSLLHSLVLVRAPVRIECGCWPVRRWSSGWEWERWEAAINTQEASLAFRRFTSCCAAQLLTGHDPYHGLWGPPAPSLIWTLLDNDIIINPMVMEIKLRHMNNFWKYYLGLKCRSLNIKIHYSKEYNFISVKYLLSA